MKIYKLSERATLPRLGSEGAAGYDLFPVQTEIVPVGKHIVVPTGIACEIRPGWYGRIAPRSGLAAKHGIDVLAGVVDSDYRGGLKVVLINHGPNDVELHPDKAIAQLIFEMCYIDRVQFIEDPVKIMEDDLAAATGRGVRGFGSTDVLEADDE